MHTLAHTYIFGIAVTAPLCASTEVYFDNPVSYPIDISGDSGLGDIVRAVAAGDLDGDGDADLVVTSGGGKVPSLVWFFRNVGDGAFLPGFSIEAGGASVGVVLADVDFDARLDVVLANNSSQLNAITLLLNLGLDGDGDWLGCGSPEQFGIGPNEQGSNAITAADFNGDELVDVVTANRNAQSISILLSDGKGGFLDAIVSSVPQRPQGITAADLDGDSDIDLATANLHGFGPNGSCTVLLNNGDGSFANGGLYEAGPNPYAVVAADLNGDNSLDLAVSSNSSVCRLRNLGGGLFESAVVGASNGGYDVVCPDLNGDLSPDLITCYYGGFKTLLNDWSGSFVSPQYWTLTGDARNISVVAIGADSIQAPLDLNGDGRTDIVVLSSEPERLIVYFNETPLHCLGDVDDNESVGISDLLVVIGLWGACSGPPSICAHADVSPLGGDGLVGIADLLAVIGSWGACPD